jgi:CBS-domain-containing membrane protein
MTNYFPVEALSRLATLTVGDVMNRHVVTVPASQEMQQVARELHRQDVSCAPVVDSAGHCVGIISATDFMRREADDAARQGELSRIPGRAWTLSTDSADAAARFMSHGVQSIAAGQSLLRAARVMCDGHLHRLVVLDEAGRPEGMISTMDVIAALLNSVDEALVTQMLDRQTVCSQIHHERASYEHPQDPRAH